MSHICNICSREFKRIYELERHKIRINKCKPIHIDESIVVNFVPPKNVINPPEILDKSQIIKGDTNIIPPIPPNNGLYPPNNLQQNIDINNQLSCTNCYKVFARSDNLKKHINGRCKGKQIVNKPTPDNSNVIELLVKIQENQKNIEVKYLQEIIELKNTIIDLQSKIKSDTTNNINSNNNTTNNTTNNIVNNITFKFGEGLPPLGG